MTPDQLSAPKIQKDFVAPTYVGKIKAVLNGIIYHVAVIMKGLLLLGVVVFQMFVRKEERSWRVEKQQEVENGKTN